MAKAIFYFLSGLGILMFGTILMSDGLKNLTGKKVRQTIGKFSKNRVQSFGFGIFSTLLFQSSVASIIMTMGLVSFGIITLFQALAMTIGSNIGTTLTMILLSFKSFDIVAILAVFTLVGAIVCFANKSEKAKQIGYAIVGFGMLYAGLLLVDYATGYFKSIDGFNQFISTLQNPFLLVLLGTVLTMLTQSSFGTVAILISIAGSGSLAYSIMSLESISFVVFGVNIGICAVTLLASISGSSNGKRTALFNLFFNLIGAVIFMLLSLTHWTDVLISLSPSVSIVIINIIFNLLTAIIILPLLTPITKLMQKIFSKNEQKNSVFVLSKNSRQIPSIALKEVNTAMVISFQNLSAVAQNFSKYFENINLKNYKKLNRLLKTNSGYVDSIEQSIFLISTSNLSEQKNLQMIGEVSQNAKRVLHNFGEIVDSSFVADKPIQLSNLQLEVINQFCKILSQIANMFESTFKHIADDELEFNFQDIANEVLTHTKNISDTKLEQKKLLIGGTAKFEKYSYFLNITNQFDEIGNDYNDMSVNISELLTKKE